MELKDRIALGWEAYKQVQDLIRFIDQKAGALSALYLFGAATFFSRAEGVPWHHLAQPRPGPWAILGLFVAVLFLVITTAQLVVLLNNIVRPRTDTPASGNQNLFYYEHVAAMELADFLQQAGSKSEQELLNDLYAQVHEVSQIAQQKVRHLSNAFKWWWLSLAVLVIFFALTAVQAP
jgi:hypothetical protein